MERFSLAIKRFDEANRQDPNTEVFEGKTCPKELLYARRMTRRLERLAPEASEVLRLAARCQHIRRWEIPRDRYPGNRVGYLKWRTDLYAFHAQKAGDILREVGYDRRSIERVQELLHKRNVKSDPDMQMLEDVICLVFLESYFTDFSRRHEEPKVLSIIRKTWKKMSEQGRKAALGLDLPEAGRALINRALTS